MTGTFVSTTLYQRSPLDNLGRQSSGKISPSGFSSPSSSKLLVRHGDAPPHSPPSPLLHTRFKAHSGSSAATSSYLDLRGDDDETVRTVKPVMNDDRWSREEDESIYHDISHDSYDSQTLTYPTPGFQYIIDAVKSKSTDLPSPMPSSAGIVSDEHMLSSASTFFASTIQDGRPQINYDSHGQFTANGSDSSDQAMIPEVVVSSPPPSVRGSFNTERPSIDIPSRSSVPNRPNKASTQYNVTNFSRPRRNINPEDEQRKLEVLERNRVKSQTSVDSRSGTPIRHAQPSYPNPYSNQVFTTLNDAATGRASPLVPSQLRSLASSPTSPSGLSVPSSLLPAQRSPTPSGRYSPNPGPSPNPSLSPSFSNTGSAEPSHSSPTLNSEQYQQHQESKFVRLPNSPPSPRITSRVSLYSTYSYYQLDDSRTPSPSTPGPTTTEFGVMLPNSRVSSPSDQRRPISPRATPTPTTPGPPTAEDYLFLGIQHHEANRLQDSATCFERAATLDGGCGVGMLMWGLTLRHAWGVPKDEKTAFIWLRRAAESAVEDLEAAREGKEQNAVKVSFRLYLR